MNSKQLKLLKSTLGSHFALFPRMHRSFSSLLLSSLSCALLLSCAPEGPSGGECGDSCDEGAQPVALSCWVESTNVDDDFFRTDDLFCRYEGAASQLGLFGISVNVFAADNQVQGHTFRSDTATQDAVRVGRYNMDDFPLQLKATTNLGASQDLENVVGLSEVRVTDQNFEVPLDSGFALDTPLEISSAFALWKVELLSESSGQMQLDYSHELDLGAESKPISGNHFTQFFGMKNTGYVVVTPGTETLDVELKSLAQGTTTQLVLTGPGQYRVSDTELLPVLEEERVRPEGNAMADCRLQSNQVNGEEQFKLLCLERTRPGMEVATMHLRLNGAEEAIVTTLSDSPASGIDVKREDFPLHVEIVSEATGEILGLKDLLDRTFRYSTTVELETESTHAFIATLPFKIWNLELAMPEQNSGVFFFGMEIPERDIALGFEHARQFAVRDRNETVNGGATNLIAAPADAETVSASLRFFDSSTNEEKNVAVELQHGHFMPTVDGLVSCEDMDCGTP